MLEVHLFLFLIRMDARDQRRRSCKKMLPALKILFNQNLNIVATANFAFLQDPGEDAFARHDTIAELLVDRTVLMALLADLRDLQNHFLPDSQPGPERHCHQLKAPGGQVLRERSGGQQLTYLGAGQWLAFGSFPEERLLLPFDRLDGQQTDLAVARRSVRIAC